jgi:uncharacterized protein YbaR (Trm112 family)
MNPRLLSIIACPHCRGGLRLEQDRLGCEECGRAFPVRDQAAIFLPEPVTSAPAGHQSNAIGAEYESILREGKRLVLHIGGGATAARYPNCIEFEHQIFRHTNVVGDAHSLPFRDDVFDYVFAFNVFEHLRDPRAAAAEIFRVLKPSGSVAIHTAFLQPLHEEPAHFYNATEYGVREWFGQFQIERCDVSANFSPAFMLAFLSSHVLEALRAGRVSPEEQKLISETSLADWAGFWADRNQLPLGFHTLMNLPQPLQKRIAAGFELLARKPATSSNHPQPRLIG